MLADYVDDGGGSHLANVRRVRPENGHFYETQWWAPDGSGFLFTESVDSATNLELFFYRLRDGHIERLTHDPAWDEQAIFTPDGKRVIFMSTRHNPSMYNEYARTMANARVTADLDYLTLLPVFEAGFLQPIFPASNDLYEIDMRTRATRRLTHDGEDGWITPELAWDPAGKRLLWTELKYRDGARLPFLPDPEKQAQGLQELAKDPPKPDGREGHGGGQSFLITRRTRLGSYLPAQGSARR
jgi:Tol biopolymer transport system component